MKSGEVLIRPILTEKANAQQEKLRRYAFKVSEGEQAGDQKSSGRILRCHCSGCEYGDCSGQGKIKVYKSRIDHRS